MEPEIFEYSEDTILFALVYGLNNKYETVDELKVHLDKFLELVKPVKNPISHG